MSFTVPESEASVDVEMVRGPLDDERLQAICELYGPTDRKYASLEYTRHQFVGNPYGWSLHAFALHEGRPVGHCGVIPVEARTATRSFVSGKFEALAVDEAHRASTAGGFPVALALLRALYKAADETEIEILHTITSAELGVLFRMAGSRPFEAPGDVYLAIGDPAAFASQLTGLRRRATLPLFLAQKSLRIAAAAAVRTVSRSSLKPTVRDPDETVRGMLRAQLAPRAWTIDASNSWSWYVGTGLLRTVEVPGARGWRAVVRRSEPDGRDLQVLGWEPRRRGLLAAVALLAALPRLEHARAIRVHVWKESPEFKTLLWACRLLGFVRLRGTTTVYLRPAQSEHGTLVLTPFLYATF